MRGKFLLARKIRDKLAAIRRTEREAVYQRCLFAPAARVEVSFDHAFTFRRDMYRDQRRYRGRWRPRRHFLGPDRVPAFDGVEDGEEFRCAQAIDSLPGLRYWVRNVARNPASFSLPVVAGRFYPDFVALLHDGRLLVVEYKGAHIAEGPDTAEKRTIGELWERESGGRCLFAMAEKTVRGQGLAPPTHGEDRDLVRMTVGRPKTGHSAGRPPAISVSLRRLGSPARALSGPGVQPHMSPGDESGDSGRSRRPDGEAGRAV